MKLLYVSEESIASCIDYFKQLDIISGEQLGMFFFFKSIGFDEKKYRAFPKVSGISVEDRKVYLQVYISFLHCTTITLKVEKRNAAYFRFQSLMK